MREFALVIQGGLVIGAGGATIADVAVEGERIVAIGENLAGAATIDAAGCYVIPGAIDPHVHLQMPLAGMVSTDTFRSGTVAAAYGGTTTIVDFVEPQPGQSMLEALARRQAEADGARL